MSATVVILKEEQANTLLDLLNDQISHQRACLRDSIMTRTHLTALAHFRNLKRLILDKAERNAQDEERRQDIKLHEILTS